MKTYLDLVLTPQEAAIKELYTDAAARQLGIESSRISYIEPTKRTIDARQQVVKINLTVLLVVDEPVSEELFKIPEPQYHNVQNKPEVIIVGTGPAGLFAALRMLQLGLKPVLIERGKDVHSRKRDIAKLHRNDGLNPESNYCFGEGGAGAFSDGKLYTRSKKRGDIEAVLQTLYLHGADKQILIEAHPHIGTDKLPQIVERIRNTIINHGGEVHFNTQLTDLIIENSTIKGIVTQSGEKCTANNVILATGHSAFDVYNLLNTKEIALEAKAFAAGVRVEHPQELIDQIQYHTKTIDKYLPSATYKIATQVENRGVYSFCMCPGGYIIPASTSPAEMVVNGMSPSKRNSPFGNSGIVVEVRLDDIKEFHQYGAFSALHFQRHLEYLAFQNGGQGLIAPAQCLNDFVTGKLSSRLPGYSYNPGLISSPLHFWLPDIIGKPLQTAFKQFGKTIKGFLTNEAIVVGVESRTSSPIRIPRNDQTLAHTQIGGLYPCGEGAGYAGGIISSAMDGIRCADKIFEKIT